MKKLQKYAIEKLKQPGLETQSPKANTDIEPENPWSEQIQREYPGSPQYSAWLAIVGNEMRSTHTCVTEAYHDLIDNGMELETWTKKYVTEWYKELSDKEEYKALNILQKRISLAHRTHYVIARKHLRPIDKDLKKFSGLSNGLQILRGAKGYLIDKKGLDIFPDNIKNEFVKCLGGNALCSFDGILITLPYDFITVKKLISENLELFSCT